MNDRESMFWFLDSNPSGAILTVGKYDRDYDWGQGDGVDDGLKDAAHFQKINSPKDSRKGTQKQSWLFLFHSIEDCTITTLSIIYHIACRDEYPRNYWKRCRLSCAKIKAKGGCRKKWVQILKGKCKLSLPKWHRNRYVNQYCKQTCMKCGKRVE